VEPKITYKAELSFPDEALGSLVTGRIWVKIQVGRDGIPVRTDIIKREPDIAYMFDEVARRWAMACRFSPAIDSSGTPVAVWVSIPLNFKIQDFKPPAVTHLAVPEFPGKAREMGMEGWVGIAILVSETGSAKNGKTVIVAREPLSTKVFDEAAIAAAKASEFLPAESFGRRNEAWCFVKIIFKLPEK
jgi:TonB family protein